MLGNKTSFNSFCSTFEITCKYKLVLWRYINFDTSRGKIQTKNKYNVGTRMLWNRESDG